jgi:hypothetical protein
MRVFGLRKSVNAFNAGFLKKHLSVENAYGQTVLTREETDVRRAMLATRLLMRNRDVWQWLEQR